MGDVEEFYFLDPGDAAPCVCDHFSPRRYRLRFAAFFLLPRSHFRRRPVVRHIFRIPRWPFISLFGPFSLKPDSPHMRVGAYPLYAAPFTSSITTPSCFPTWNTSRKFPTPNFALLNSCAEHALFIYFLFYYLLVCFLLLKHFLV